MRSTKVAMRDGRTLTSDHTGRGEKNIDTHKSSSAPRIPFPNAPRSIQPEYSCRIFESVPGRIGLLRRRTKEVERELSALSTSRIPCLGRPWFAYLDYHDGDIEPMFDKSSRLRLHRLRLEPQKVEKDSVSRILLKGVFSSSSLISHLDYKYHDLRSVFNAFDHDVFGPDVPGTEFFGVMRICRLNGLRRLVLQDVKRNWLVLHPKYKRLLKISEPQPPSIRKQYECKKSRKQIIDRPRTDFPVERKQGPRVKLNAYRLLVGRHSSREPKDYIIRKTTNFNDLQAQREPSDERAIWSSIDMSKNSLKKMSEWKLWEGRSKEWRRCKVLKVLSSTPFDAHAVKGKKLESLRWEKAAAIAPIAMLQRDPYFRKAHAPRKQVANEYRRKESYKRSWRARAFETEAEAYYDEPTEQSEPLNEPVHSFKNTRRNTRAPPLKRLGGQAPNGKEQKQKTTLQALDSRSRYIRSTRSTVAELHRSPTMEAAGEIQTNKDEPKSVVARGSKQRTPNLGDGDDEVAGSPRVTDVRTQRQRMHVAEQSPKLATMEAADDTQWTIVSRKKKRKKGNMAEQSQKLATMEAADDTQWTNVPEKKKRKKRNRGLKKAKVPRFETLEELESFLATLRSKLTIQRTKIFAIEPIAKYSLFANNWEPDQRVKHKRMAKTAAATQRQYDTLSSRFSRAQKERDDWYLLLRRTPVGVSEYGSPFEDEVLDLVETSWTLRKNPPFGARSDKKRSSIAELDHLYWEKWEDIERLLNGEEELYGRL